MDDTTKGTRRRGEVLEEAILLAAWTELSETGYAQLTMESVATRSRTNKAVLYRRWGNKTELVVAAIRRHLPKITNDAPNTGSLRDDVCAYLRGLMEPLRLIGAQTLRGLIVEPVMWRNVIASMPQPGERRPESKMTAAMMEILKNAELRGEITLGKLAPRVISLPLDLLQREVLAELEPVSDEAIAEIVDSIFMPLVHAAQP